MAKKLNNRQMEFIKEHKSQYAIQDKFILM